MADEQASYLTIEPLLKPKTVAVLGASAKKSKLGYLQVKALLDGGFQGDIYPINPKSEMITGLRCFPSLSETPKNVDLAIFCVSADKVEDCLEECGQNNVKAAIIFASGFSEIGEEGMKAQQRMKQIARENGIRIIGPNCVGLVNTTNGLVGTFSPGLTQLPLSDKREVGFITQSGAFGVLTYIAAAQNGLTFNYFVSVGNEVETEFSDIMEYMIHDSDTSVISGYLEGEKNPNKLRQLADQALVKNKPIIVMKSGRSSAGSRAAASHTGSLAGSDKIYDGFFQQTGIIRADDYEDIISFSKLFLSKKLPTGRNTVLITSSGGRGINEADRCESYGLKINRLSEETKDKIKQNIPSYGSASNPIDLTAEAAVTNPELFLAPLKALVEDPDTDIIIFTEFPMAWKADDPHVKAFIEICKNTDKLVFVTTFPLEGMSIPNSAAALEKNGIPVIPGNLNPISALAKLVNYSEKYHKMKLADDELMTEWDKKEDISSLLQPGTTLSESQASDVLASYGIPTTKRAVASSEDNAVSHADKIGYPVALKIDSPDIPHKSEANAIKLNLKNDLEVSVAFKEIMQNAKNYKPNAKINGVSVQQMLPEGVEVIVGVTNDPAFGPVIMFGLGGVFVEIFQDISFRVAPITKNDAIEMIEEIKGYKILKGARGKPPVDIDAIADVLLRVSKLVSDYKDEIKELDINPLIVYEKGIVAADAMLVVNESKNQTSVVGR
ncbi:acetate--CoA ligase family protein [Lentibacillus sp. Marseille-P4043]|uniref:acetate--CoA ligase family protein n=1 Tax=Lentibacillus sp. Marseille-P4043 TaxID=2040293 RepID=UPI000D0B73CB|nr:acetate--CoA ligase family protein [Lentibacillus sp. Marseille-P4043]